MQQRVMMPTSQTAEEIYQQFIKTYPDILLRVPQVIVASYLPLLPSGG
ncbi:MAG: hypothetical protein JNL03_14735 [Prolixibacteraceae bacterium]|nr:hypothetical protein [Prolixibacteraceae bacterium]